MIRIKDIEKDNKQKDEEDDEREKVSKHDPGVEAERLDNDVVKEHGDEACEDVDEADVEDNGGAGEAVLEEVSGGHKTVVWQQEAHARHHHHQVHKVVLKYQQIK